MRSLVDEWLFFSDDGVAYLLELKMFHDELFYFNSYFLANSDKFIIKI